MNSLILILSSGILILFSAICSGLNVGLMSLHVVDLKRKAKLGNKQAAAALSIRENAHFYLSGILLTNVAVASGTAIVLAHQFSGLVAGLLSTVLLVVFGEITPQAIAVKHALGVVSFFAPAIKLVTYATYPATKTLEMLLDKLVGKTEHALHTRHELGLLIADHTQDSESELDEDEVEIVRNALKLSEKKVSEIMTPVDKVYSLKEDDIIDADKIDELKYENWSRIPVFDDKKEKCSSFLMLKDLVDIDFDIRSYSLDELRSHKAFTVGSKTALDTLFRRFIDAKRHLLIVEKDDKIVGIVTIEDLIEEIIGHEIEDESDE
ncbi:MAG: CNNM domain-containing protein [Candidatus Saccharibacteria bacterium]|nr:CNNM domain-containing protein [Candidatus Saccharibacteria bacterium]